MTLSRFSFPTTIHFGAGARAAQVSGSGPTVFGLFADQHEAATATGGIPGSLVTMVAAR